MPLFGGSAGPDGKEDKESIAPTHTNPWEVTLIAGQFIFGDNNEFANTGDLSTDPWIFDEQLIVDLFGPPPADAMLVFTATEGERSGSSA